MSRKKFLLKKKKNTGTPAHRKRHAQRNMSRILYNASLKYKCSTLELQSAKLILKPYKFQIGCLYQEILIKGNSHTLKRPRVLSLFDGISSGFVALQQLGINPSCYFSSEIDPYCLKLQRFHFGKNIYQLGNICELQCEKLKELGQIDILVGGSPCDDLSMVNPNRQGLTADSGSGPLFFEFMRVLLYFKNLAHFQNRSHEFFFLFENTANMDSKTKQTISSYLELEPFKICSSRFVPMKRQRYFWTNIPLSQDQTKELQSSRSTSDRGHILQDFLCGSGRTAVIDVLPTFTSNLSNIAKGGILPVVDSSDGPAYPYLCEIEQLFGFPLYYTAGPNTPLHIRKRQLAKCWDIHTIKFIFQELKKKLILT